PTAHAAHAHATHAHATSETRHAARAAAHSHPFHVILKSFHAVLLPLTDSGLFFLDDEYAQHFILGLRKDVSHHAAANISNLKIARWQHYRSAAFRVFNLAGDEPTVVGRVF